MPTTQPKTEPAQRSAKSSDYLQKSLVAILLTLIGYAGSMLMSHERRLVHIESTRYTPGRVEAEVQPKLDLLIQEIKYLRRDLSKIERDIVLQEPQ